MVKARDEAIPDLTALRAALKSLSDKVLKVDLNDKAAVAAAAALQLQFARLQRTLDRTKISDIGALRAAAQIAVLDAAIGRLQDKAGGGGFFSRLFGGGGGIGGILAKIGGIQAGPLPVAGWAGIAAAAAAIPGALAGVLGIIPGLVAATMGVAAFGALAIPTFGKVAAAVTAVGAATTRVARDKAWDAIPKAIQPVVRGVLQLQSIFDSMAAKLAPALIPIMKTLVDIGKNVLPALLPFARSAASAIETLLRGFDRFTTPGQVQRVHDTLTAVKALGAMPPGSNAPSGFQLFMAQMAKLSGPFLAALGEGLGKVTVAIGRLLQAMINPRALVFLADFFHGLAIAIDWLSNLVKWLTTAGRANIQFGRDVGRAVMDALHFFGQLLAGQGPVWNGIRGWLDKAAGWFADFPARVAAALVKLGPKLLAIGAAAATALLRGLASLIPGLQGWASTVIGILNAVGIAVGSVRVPGAGSAGGGPVVPAPVGGPHHLAIRGAGPLVSLAVQPGGSGLDQMFMTWLANGIRVRGGDPGILYRKVVFA